VDNLSKDKTLSVLKELQFKENFGSKIVIIKNKENYGLGGSQKIAYQYFIDHQFSHFMIIHGDNQGNADEIARFFFEVFEKEPDVDLILASRFHPSANTSHYNAIRLLGNHFFNFMTYLLTGHKMSDAGTGIMFIRTEILKQIPFACLTNSFQFNPQLNILLYNLKDLKTQEVPLNWRDSEAGSNIRSLDYCCTLLRILIKYRINKSILAKTSRQLFDGNLEGFQPRFEIDKK
jgi:glycosyltransferase involved in cell wall biosynthesis